MQNNPLKTHRSLIASLVIYWGVLTGMVVASIWINDGHFIYPLDDTYIHMAIAKNFALHGVWGVTEYGFTSSTSSPFWTALLAVIYAIFGVNQVAPIILNVLFGTAILWSVDFILQKYIRNAHTGFFILCVIVFTAPLPTLTFVSMEYTLHGLLNLWFVYLSAQAIAAPQVNSKGYALLTALAFFLTITRYEGLLAVGIVCTLLLFNRKWKASFLLGTAGLLPVIIYGIWSVANGWYFIPNSILIKANTSMFSLGGDRPPALDFLLTNLWRAPDLIVLLFLSVIFSYKRISKAEWDDITYLHIIFIALSVFQIGLARVGRLWLFRYEAFLVILGILVFSITLTSGGTKQELIGSFKSMSTWQRGIYIVITFILVVPFMLRVYDSLQRTPQASTNIYEQQFQMAKFLRQYYPAEAVAINDIGAISFFTDVHLVDFAGLGNIESARAKLFRSYATETLRELARAKNVKIAIVYEDWYVQYGGLPVEWEKVGAWQVRNNVILGRDRVAFLVVDPAEKNRLMQDLAAFSAQLPADVEQHGKYMVK